MSSLESSDWTRILLVEDNLLDARATLRALQDLTRPHRIDHLTNGSDALDALDEHARSSTPLDLVVLDLNASGVRGLDVLRAVKSDARLEQIPVVILSTSDAPDDIEAAGRHGAHAYFIKPLSLDGWAEIIAALDVILAGETP